MSTAKNIFKILASAFNKVHESIELESAKLPDGTTIEADEWEVGATAFIATPDGEPVPLPAGTYELDNGVTIVTDENGVITELMPTDEMSPEDEIEGGKKKPDTEMYKKKMESAPPKKIVETQSKETMFSKAEVDAKILEAVEQAKIELSQEKDKEIEAIKLQVAELSKEKEVLETRLAEQPAAKKLSRNPEGSPSKVETPKSYRMTSTPAQRILQRIKN